MYIFIYTVNIYIYIYIRIYINMDFFISFPKILTDNKKNLGNIFKIT